MATQRDSVFDYLAEAIEKLPEQVQEAAVSATKEAVNKYGMRMYDYLKQHGTFRDGTVDGADKLAGQHLRDHIYHKDNFDKAESADAIWFYVDWDNTLVNPKLSGAGINANAETGRGKYTGGKRNYSMVPATWHDLAYILATGRTIKKKDGTTTIVAGKPFLVQGVRKKSGWKGYQTKEFAKKIDVIAKELK